VKSLMLLWQELAKELAMWCSTSADRDINTVSVRTEHEGVSFLTITLPAFGKEFERALDQGYIADDQFTGFRAGSGGLPRFLGGFLQRVFDPDNGVLVEDPCKDSVFAIRQLTLIFGKLEIECSKERTKSAFQGYIDCEKDVHESNVRRTPEVLSEFLRISDMLFAGVFSRMENSIHKLELVARHGPGATADKLSGNRKFTLCTWTSRLERILPSGEFLLPNWSYTDRFGAVDILEPEAEIPVRVISVPKTLKTPRIIGIEPSWHQYSQQALLPVLLDALSSYDTLDRMLGFDDQVPNQEMARIGSLTGSFATLDLSEASDRVSNQLVRAMMRNHPLTDEAVQASRSFKADVLGEIYNLNKFASMGSALTFPIEAMVFLTCVLLGIEKASNTPLNSHRDLRHLVGQVRIYGDDIIIPVDYATSVTEALELFGFKVNSGKSFWTGKFRESCGGDYYAGFDVTPVRFRRVWPSTRKDATEVISLVSFRNQLYERGLWQTCGWLDEKIRKLLKSYPVVLPSSPVLGRQSYLGYEVERTGKHMHNPLVRGWVVQARIPINQIDDADALLKVLSLRAYQDLHSKRVQVAEASNEDHLERSGRPQSVNLKLRWMSPW